MELTALSFSALLGYLQQAIAGIVDPRRPSNGTRYSLQDMVLAAFSCFFMQSESFLEHQRQLNSRCGQDNAQTLFGLERIPTVEQMRNLLDGIAARHLFVVFEWIYRALNAQGYLRAFELLEHNLLVALDGTEYYRSQKIHCPCCSTRTHKDGKITYCHQALLPVIVHPEQASVLSLPPEFITPQDGCEKQDCELNAAKRWVTSHAGLFEGQPVTLLGDDLFGHQPMCQHSLDHQFNFLFVCLPQSHPSLYEWLDFLSANGDLKTTQQRRWNGRYFEVWHYRYLNQVPLRDEQPALLVNWFELKVIRESDGEQLYLNSWITNHDLTPQRLFQLGPAGRSRWKTENENHNVLKTRGYHLEHNFGHGQRHLAMVLLTLNLLAFLFHTVLEWVDERYQRARAQRGTRKGFFQDLLSLTKYLLFENWQHLLDFLLDDSGPRRAPYRANTS
jgi:hypothetical protein